MTFTRTTQNLPKLNETEILDGHPHKVIAMKPLSLTNETRLEQIKQFFSEAGPDARIRARQMTGGQVELYVRDMSLMGMLTEWWNTNSDDRKSSYEAAKQKIEAIVRPSIKEGEIEHYQSIFKKHKQDFVASEIVGLQNQLEAKDLIATSLDKSFGSKPSLSVRPGKPQEAPRKEQTALDAMNDTLQRFDFGKAAKFLAELPPVTLKKHEIQGGGEEFRKVINYNSSADASRTENVSIDFVAARNFLMAINVMATNKFLEREFQVSQKLREKLAEAFGTLGRENWELLISMAKEVSRTTETT